MSRVNRSEPNTGVGTSCANWKSRRLTLGFSLTPLLAIRPCWRLNWFTRALNLATEAALSKKTVVPPVVNFSGLPGSGESMLGM